MDHKLKLTQVLQRFEDQEKEVERLERELKSAQADMQHLRDNAARTLKSVLGGKNRECLHNGRIYFVSDPPGRLGWRAFEGVILGGLDTTNWVEPTIGTNDTEVSHGADH